MFTSSYDYILPDDLIGQEPVTPRDDCRLMALSRKDESIGHYHFYDLPSLLRSGDVLVFNKSRVIPARLLLEHNNRQVEVFLTRRINEHDWLALVRPGRLFQPGKKIPVSDDLSLEVRDIRDDGQRVIHFSMGGAAQDKILRRVGRAPYPPYIRNTRASFEDYQTVFAEIEGSIAAPTAGLHFTDRLLKELDRKKIQLEFVTLHVGLGTFLPIKADRVEDHFMHHESYSLDSVTAERLDKAKAEGRRIIAVGTTVVRVLESSYDIKKGFIPQERDTNIFIFPGYEWKCVDALITNFHLPKSSLLLLVCSFAGRDFVFRAYEEAIHQKYRFFSFGDAMFIE